MCYSGPMATNSPRVAHLQMELPLSVAPCPGFRVREVEGHIVLTPTPLEMWGSTEDAARMIRRSSRWVRMLCEMGVIRARRLPGARRWDVDLLDLQRWIESGALNK